MPRFLRHYALMPPGCSDAIARFSSFSICRHTMPFSPAVAAVTLTLILPYAAATLPLRHFARHAIFRRQFRHDDVFAAYAAPL